MYGGGGAGGESKRPQLGGGTKELGTYSVTGSYTYRVWAGERAPEESREGWWMREGRRAGNATDMLWTSKV